MKLNQLPPTTTRSKTRLGRGVGTGSGSHTVGRGQKGQRSRNKIAVYFEGGQLPLTKRMPYLRGKSRFGSLTTATAVVNVAALNTFPTKAKITKESLVKAGLITLKEAASGRVKILGGGDLTRALTIVGLSTSRQAAAKITKAGGSIADSPREPDSTLTTIKPSNHPTI